MKQIRANVTKMQVWIFTVVWLSYAGVYLLRKPFGIIKLSMKESMNLTEDLLGYIELAFSLPYALCSIFFGFIGDKLGPRITLGGGIIGSAIATSLMGLGDNYVLFLILLFISGMFQSLTAPACMAILADIFPHNSLTTVMGIFCVSSIAGSVVSTFITVKILEISSWHNVFYIPSGIALAVGLADFIFLRNNINDKVRQEKNKPKDVSLNFWSVLKLPKILCSSFGLFFLKGIRNATFFWLPYYLSSVLHYSETDAAFITLIYEIGSFLGPLVLSVVINLYLDDLVASLLTIILSAAFTLLLVLVENGYSSYILYISLFFSGVSTSTADVVFGAAYITKLGNKHGARSSIISVVNGIGSIGNIVSGPLVAYLSYWFSMKALVPCIVVSCFFSACAIILLIIQQNRDSKKLSSVNSKNSDQVVLKRVTTLTSEDNCTEKSSF